MIFSELLMRDAQKSKLTGGQDDLFVQYGDMAIAGGVPGSIRQAAKNLAGK